MTDKLLELKAILSVLIACIPAVIFILKNSKNKRLQKAAATLLVIANKVKEFIIKEEDSVEYSGDAKKKAVVTKVKEYCIDNKIQYTDQIIDKSIEEAIAFSKRVNATPEKIKEVASIENKVEDKVAKNE